MEKGRLITKRCETVTQNRTFSFILNKGIIWNYQHIILLQKTPWCSLLQVSLKDSDALRAVLFCGSLLEGSGKARRPSPPRASLCLHRWQTTASICHRTVITPCLVLRLYTWGRCFGSYFIMPWMTFGCLQLQDFRASLLLSSIKQHRCPDRVPAHRMGALCSGPSCCSILLFNKNVFSGTFIVL